MTHKHWESGRRRLALSYRLRPARCNWVYLASAVKKPRPSHQNGSSRALRELRRATGNGIGVRAGGPPHAGKRQQRRGEGVARGDWSGRLVSATSRTTQRSCRSSSAARSRWMTGYSRLSSSPASSRTPPCNRTPWRLVVPRLQRPRVTTRTRRLHADAATRWRLFGDVPEFAYALVGQGRCLVALGTPGADRPLSEARELFTAMGYAPAIGETDALLQRTGATTS